MFSALSVVVAFAALDFGAAGDGVAKDTAATAEDFKRISNRFWFREVER